MYYIVEIHLSSKRNCYDVVFYVLHSINIILILLLADHWSCKWHPCAPVRREAGCATAARGWWAGEVEDQVVLY